MRILFISNRIDSTDFTTLSSCLSRELYTDQLHLDLHLPDIPSHLILLD